MENYSVVWTDRSYLSLQKAHDFLVENNSKGAKKFVKDLLIYCQTLETLPRRHPIEPNLKNELVEYRFLVKNNFKVIYTIVEDEKMVLIILVFETRQNPSKMKI
jgi:toxin ParE1/3/4